jgi:hypothetical protein
VHLKIRRLICTFVISIAVDTIERTNTPCKAMSVVSTTVVVRAPGMPVLPIGNRSRPGGVEGGDGLTVEEGGDGVA